MIYYINDDTIGGVYKKLGEMWGSGKLNGSLNTLAIEIKNTDIISFQLFNVHYPYIKDFFNKNILDTKWDKNNEEWYLSYSRRLIEKRNGISQFEQAVKCLRQNKNSRRCVLCACDPIDNGDYRPALLTVTMKIMNNKLHMFVHWRSQELFFAFPMNVLSMFSFQRIFYKHLVLYYPELKIGYYHQYTDVAFMDPNALKITNWNFMDYLNLIPQKTMEFYWSIILKNEEGKYDENYR